MLGKYRFPWENPGLYVNFWFIYNLDFGHGRRGHSLTAIATKVQGLLKSDTVVEESMFFCVDANSGMNDTY